MSLNKLKKKSWKSRPKAVWDTACARQCGQFCQTFVGGSHQNSVNFLLLQRILQLIPGCGPWNCNETLLLRQPTTDLGAALRHLIHALVDQVLQVRPGGRASLSDRWNWGVLHDKKTFIGWCQARRRSLTEWQVELGSLQDKNTFTGWCQARRWSFTEWQVEMGSSVTMTFIGWCQARRWSLTEWQMELGSSVTKTSIGRCQARRWSLTEWQVALGSSVRPKNIHWQTGGGGQWKHNQVCLNVNQHTQNLRSYYNLCCN